MLYYSFIIISFFTIWFIFLNDWKWWCFHLSNGIYSSALTAIHSFIMKLFFANGKQDVALTSIDYNIKSIHLCLAKKVYFSEKKIHLMSFYKRFVEYPLCLCYVFLHFSQKKGRLKIYFLTCTKLCKTYKHV